MIFIAILLTIFFSFFSEQINSSALVLRKDYECEIFEKDFYIKDCYRNVDLNFDDKKMIADISE